MKTIVCFKDGFEVLKLAALRGSICCRHQVQLVLVELEDKGNVLGPSTLPSQLPQRICVVVAVDQLEPSSKTVSESFTSQNTPT